MPQLTPTRRSQLLQMLLEQQAQSHRGQRSGFEMIANLGAKFMQQKQIEKLREQEMADDQKLIEALTSRQQGTPGSGPTTTTQGEAIMGDEGDPFTVTKKERGTKIGRDIHPDALARVLSLPSGQRGRGLAALQAVHSMQPEAKEPKGFKSLGLMEVRPKNGEPFDAPIFWNQDENRHGFFDEKGNFTPVSGNHLGPSTKTQVNIEAPVDEEGLNTDAVESYQASQQLRFNLQSTSEQVERAPGATGTRGRIGTIAGGFATNVMGPEAGDQVTQIVSGVDQRELGAVQARLKTVKAQLIPVVTGETSGRFTDTEQRLAGDAIQLVDKIVDFQSLGANFPALQGALRELTVAALENEFTQAKFSEAVNPPYDLSDMDDVTALAQDLLDNGFNENEVETALLRFKRIHSGR